MCSLVLAETCYSAARIFKLRSFDVHIFQQKKVKVLLLNRKTELYDRKILEKTKETVSRL